VDLVGRRSDELEIMKEKEIIIELTNDEALVLFEFIIRLNQTESKSDVRDLAEQKVLWAIETQLEKVLIDPFKPDYLKILEEARSRLKN
jgi:hypothetical protein